MPAPAASPFQFLRKLLSGQGQAGERKTRRAPGVAWPDAGMKAVLEAMQEPALLADRALTLRFCNAASQTTFGAMALGDPVSLRFRTPELVAAAQAVLTDAQPRRVALMERSPLARFFEIEIAGIRPEGADAPVLLLFIMRDRTGERKIERMRTDFVANASHELRTPLASLIGFIETLQGPARNDVKARERFLDIMREQAGRMSRLLDDLLSLSRIEMRPALAPGERANLCEILTSVRDAMEARALAAGLSLELVLPKTPVIVNGNADELSQVFSNLVENAVKYAGGGERVILGLRSVVQDANIVEAYVQDFGKGIAAEHVPRLTERFYRVEDGKTKAIVGTGLGLSIVRNILQRHQTRLQVQSRPESGSTFSVRFTLMKA
ncbi:ATP-binding protein [Aureimonas frigidaquae]|uniref:ATP-binding protein n=1 Tax=Aureimonas frigidaquae TaxID=424757 RepID=UPI0007835D7E|nr:ATP-binding protein [Aureimonas frigidaquae]